MPYRTFRVLSHDGQPETFRVRVSDAAIAEWLPERAHLKRRGYPDRPPDVDTPTLRAWLPRLGEMTLPYFRDRPARSAGTGEALAFPVFTAAWYRPSGTTTKVLVTGFGDGSFMSRVVIVNASGDSPVDKVHRLGPDVDPGAVWTEVETIVRAINEAPMGWDARGPLVTTYLDYLRLDEEVEVAEAEARATGLLVPEWLH
ncbi:MAG TPA: hypothetical protein VIK13_12645 [Candidatus Limnocylindrales bacterium]